MELRDELIHLYITEGKTGEETASILGMKSIFYHLKRFGIVKDHPFRRKRKDSPSRGWTDKHKNRWISFNGRVMLEHRYIMEKHISRPLTENEVVHHVNKNRLDNRIENLQLMGNREHSKYHSIGQSMKRPLTEAGRQRKSKWMKTAWENGKFSDKPFPSEEARKKQSDSLKRAWKEGRFANRPGHQPSEETRAKMSETHKKRHADGKGHKFTDEDKKHLSDIQKRLWTEGKYANRRRPVL